MLTLPCISLYFHPSVHPSTPLAILSSVKSYVNLRFPFMLTSKMGTHMQMHNPSHFSQHTLSHTHSVSHPFSSPSDELLSCLLDIGSMRPQSRLAANHMTMRRTLTSPACSAFASSLLNRRPPENLHSGWLWGALRVGRSQGELERRETHPGNNGVKVCTNSMSQSRLNI